MKRLLVNDMLSALPGHRTFWNDLQDWFGCEFVGGDYQLLSDLAEAKACDCLDPCSLIIRNASYFPPIPASKEVPTIGLVQDIFTEGPAREMQEAVMRSSKAVVWNSEFTRSRYGALDADAPPKAIQVFVSGAFLSRVIPLPVDFSVFEPGNPMGLQQLLGLPDGCVCWIGACREAGYVKGWDIFIQVARLNPDLHFVAVLKDAMPDSFPPNVRCYVRLPQEELVRVIGACRVGLCTSRMESQHLAGIEMGACGLPLVVPPVGAYYGRSGDALRFMVLVDEFQPEQFAVSLRYALSRAYDHQEIRSYWQREFDKPVIKAAWEKLVEEVERGN